MDNQVKKAFGGRCEDTALPLLCYWQRITPGSQLNITVLREGEGYVLTFQLSYPTDTGRGNIVAPVLVKSDGLPEVGKVIEYSSISPPENMV